MGVRSVKQTGDAAMRTEMEPLADAGAPAEAVVIPPAVVENVVVDLAVDLDQIRFWLFVPRVGEPMR